MTELEIHADSVDTAIENACAIVAPTWPLDRFIAVDPFWEWVETKLLPEVSTILSGLSGSPPFDAARLVPWRMGERSPSRRAPRSRD